MYFKGYPPIKAKINTMTNVMAVVEKLAGKINASTVPTGNHI